MKALRVFIIKRYNFDLVSWLGCKMNLNRKIFFSEFVSAPAWDSTIYLETTALLDWNPKTIDAFLRYIILLDHDFSPK